MADGILPAIVAPDAQGVPRRYSRLSAVWAQRDRLAQRILLPDLAEQLGVRYHEIYNTVRRLGLAMEQHPATRMYEVTPEAANTVRSEFERVRALHRRSMKLPAAALQLRRAASTVRLLAQRGDLEVDPETDSSGLRLVTRTSVKAYWIAHSEAKRRPAQPIAAVPLAEVARFTGETPRALVDLVRSRVLEEVPGRRAVHLTATSLRAWMARAAVTTPAAVRRCAGPFCAAGDHVVPRSRSRCRQRTSWPCLLTAGQEPVSLRVNEVCFGISKIRTGGDDG